MITYDIKYFEYDDIDILAEDTLAEYEDRGEWRKYIANFRDFYTRESIFGVYVEWYAYIYGIHRNELYYVFTDDEDEAWRIYNEITSIRKASRMLKKIIV